MTERYSAQIHFAKEKLSDDEYEEILSKFEGLDQVEIETRKDEFQEGQFSEAATTIALNAAAVIVHGIDVLVSLYQLARSHPAFVRASFQDGDGNEILPVERNYIDAGAVGEESVVVVVEGDVNAEGDVYLVGKSGIGWMKGSETETDHEE